jgi:hypothetical protein
MTARFRPSLPSKNKLLQIISYHLPQSSIISRIAAMDGAAIEEVEWSQVAFGATQINHPRISALRNAEAGQNIIKCAIAVGTKKISPAATLIAPAGPSILRVCDLIESGLHRIMGEAGMHI